MRRVPRTAVLVLAAACAACEKTTPSEPETRPVLVLTYTGPCGTDGVLVTIDGVAAGRVRIPGTTSFLVEAGPHQLQVGTSPSFPVEMPADRDLGLTNVPSACP